MKEQPDHSDCFCFAQKNDDQQFTAEQISTGKWIRILAGKSIHGWHAFYLTSMWRKKRISILARDHHECQRCRKKGRHSNATMVHHIKHLDEYPELALTDENLVSLCDECHLAEHPEKQKHWFKRKKRFMNEERF